MAKAFNGQRYLRSSLLVVSTSHSLIPLISARLDVAWLLIELDKQRPITLIVRGS
jgi:hypothetical protein